MSGSKLGAERRKDRRFSFRVPLVVVRGGTELVLHTEDVSYAGLLVRTDTPMQERQLVRLRATLPPTGDVLAVMGMVARNIPARAGRLPGVGIQLYSLGAEQRRRWFDFIRLVIASQPAVGSVPAPLAAPGSGAGSAPAAARTPPEPVRRRYPRHAAMLQVRLHSVDDLQVLYTRNISKGGLFVGTTLELAEGTSLKVSVIHPRTREQFTLEAMVRRRATAPEPGLGLEFAGLTEARRDEFQEFISSEIPVEEVVYVSEGDQLLASPVMPGEPELIDFSDLEPVSDEPGQLS